MITTYEVRNVLRVYGNQLKRRSGQGEAGRTSYESVDLVDISVSARRRQMLNQISNQLISKIAPAKKRDSEGRRQVPASKLLSSESG